MNPALLTYVTSTLPTRTARRMRRRRERRISRRLETKTIDRLVAEYMTGTTSAELGRRYGIAKSSVLSLVRQAGEQVRHPRLSVAETAQLVEMYEAGLPQRTSRNGLAEARVLCGTVYDGQDCWGRQTATDEVGPHFARH